LKTKTEPSKSPKLKDVAAKAGVSPTTASMVFSGNGRISKETVHRVLAEAKAIQYKHKSRKTRNTRKKITIALLILIDPEWSFIWHFLTDMISRIDWELSQHEMKTVIIPVSHHEKHSDIYDKITNLECHAVFSIHFGNEKLFEKLEKNGIPTIIILNNNYQEQYFSISVDDFQGAYEGTRYLLQLGHEDIGFIDSFREDLPMLSSDRYYGYRKAIEEAGIHFNEESRLNCSIELTQEELEFYFQNIMNQPKPPTAFFCLDDEIGIRVWNALNSIGYSIPDNISILAPGDVLDYSKPYIPPITTMHIDMSYLGKLAVEMLSSRLKNDLETLQVLKVKQQLVERGSCKAI